MRLLIDMNLSPRWVELCGRNGIEATHWSSLGAPTAPDEEIMRRAAAGGMIVLTHDLDFGAILAATKGAKPSVIQLRADDTSPEAAGPAVLQAIRQCAPELTHGALITVDVARFRVTLLPLRT